MSPRIGLWLCKGWNTALAVASSRAKTKLKPATNNNVDQSNRLRSTATAAGPASPAPTPPAPNPAGDSGYTDARHHRKVRRHERQDAGGNEGDDARPEGNYETERGVLDQRSGPPAGRRQRLTV